MAEEKSIKKGNLIVRILAALLISYFAITTVFFVSSTVARGVFATPGTFIGGEWGKGEYATAEEPFICPDRNGMNPCSGPEFILQGFVGLVILWILPWFLFSLPYGWIVYVLVLVCTIVLVKLSNRIPGLRDL